MVSPEQVAKNVDSYLAALDARGKGRVQLALVALCVWPMLTLRPPLPALAPATRKQFLERRFIEDVEAARTFRPLRPFVQVMIRTGAQMSYLGYYGDRRSWESIGYTPYQDRRPDGRAAGPSDPPEPPLRTLTVPPRDGGRGYDTLVVGSGAAGSILAFRFAQAGRKVLVLERGPHLDPRQFTDDEVGQYLRLYNEGALQLATNFSLQVLQGMCVGGGTTINNALCLPPPAPVLDAWAERGVDRAGLEAAIDEVRRWLGVCPIRPETTTIAARRFAKAVGELGLPGAARRDGGEHHGGLPRDRLLQHRLRVRGQAGGARRGAAVGAGALRRRRARRRRGRADRYRRRPRRRRGRTARAERRAALARRRRGRRGGRADRLELAAAAQRPRRRRASAQGLHFNINSPLTADFPDPVDSFAGIQMSHAYVPPGDPPGYLVETWFNPPATQALAMPGWFDHHFENMHRYRHMAAGACSSAPPRPAA